MQYPYPFLLLQLAGFRARVWSLREIRLAHAVGHNDVGILTMERKAARRPPRHGLQAISIVFTFDMQGRNVGKCGVSDWWVGMQVDGGSASYIERDACQHRRAASTPMLHKGQAKVK